MTVKRIRLQLPTVPNVVRYDLPVKTDEPKPSIDVADMTDDELTALGQWWTAELIRHAKHRRETQRNLAKVDNTLRS